MTAPYEIEGTNAHPMDGRGMSAVEESLIRARFEVLPLRGVAEQAAQFPLGTTVTVTASPRKGIEATIDLAVTLAALGLHAVPHLAARLITGTAHLTALLSRLSEVGIDEVFVVAGDSPTPAGPFPDALSLLRRMDALGIRPGHVGITGYPERHALIPDDAAIAAMADKSRHADYIVSQICFEPRTIADWVTTIRSRGIGLPLYVGVPGAVDASKLLRISLRIGLGDSIRFLRKQHGVVGKMLSRYSPDTVVDDLAGYLGAAGYGIAGWHLFTFNEIAATLRWRYQAVQHHQEESA
ncbi:MAG: methylenetetrahydrofolate reductase [Sciscionella sp.]